MTKFDHYIFIKIDNERDKHLYTVIFDRIVPTNYVKENICSIEDVKKFEKESKYLRKDTDSVDEVYKDFIRTCDFYVDKKYVLLDIFKKYFEIYNTSDLLRYLIVKYYIKDYNVYKVEVNVCRSDSRLVELLVYNSIEEASEHTKL